MTDAPIASPHAKTGYEFLRLLIEMVREPGETMFSIEPLTETLYHIAVQREEEISDVHDDPRFNTDLQCGMLFIRDTENTHGGRRYKRLARPIHYIAVSFLPQGRYLITNLHTDGTTELQMIRKMYEFCRTGDAGSEWNSDAFEVGLSRLHGRTKADPVTALDVFHRMHQKSHNSAVFSSSCRTVLLGR